MQSFQFKVQQPSRTIYNSLVQWTFKKENRNNASVLIKETESNLSMIALNKRISMIG